MRRSCGPGLLLALGVVASAALVQPAAAADTRAADSGDRFTFAVVGSATTDDDRATPMLLRAIGDGAARFVVHFDTSRPSRASCSDAASERRRQSLDASAKPVVPVIGAAQWADCGDERSDPAERLERLGDTLYASDESLGQSRLNWARQGSTARFHRSRENLRWQSGRVLFVTINLPDNNNNFRVAAGRNGEFEERVAANRAWLERAFRLATERRLAGIVLFVEAAPRFGKPLRSPDLRSAERDGYYEWKLALRDFVTTYKGTVLLVQSRHAPTAAAASGIDRPLLDAEGKPIANLLRIALPTAASTTSTPSQIPPTSPTSPAVAADFATHWLRVDVDPATRTVFSASVETLFDDPSGELYGGRRPD